MGTMKSWFVGSVMIAFIAIAAFGFLAMGYGQGCIAETAAQATCPVGNVFAAVNFLLNIFKSFSSAHLLSFFVVTFLILSASGLFFIISRSGRENHTASLLSHELNSATHPTQAKIEFANWLSLLEKRDPAFLF